MLDFLVPGFWYGRSADLHKVKGRSRTKHTSLEAA